MFIDKINLNHLRIFEYVFRAGSMTAAAQELHLTQSGVSQHIRTLEDLLSIKLFDRIAHRLVPTNAAHLLFSQCVDSFNKLEKTLSTICEGEFHLNGTVNIGTPIEFGNNIILPLLSKFSKTHPAVSVILKYGFSTYMNKEIIDGSLDFAFFDGFGIDRRITTEIVYDETLLLCATEQFLSCHGTIEETPQLLLSLDYVDYQIGEPLLNMWFRHHLGINKVNLNIRAIVMNVQGISYLILDHFAAGILPQHLATKLEKEGFQLYFFKGCGKPLINKISIAYLKERTLSSAAYTLMKWLLAELQYS